MSAMTKQEMFNLAVRGLASQGWEPSAGSTKYSRRMCVYEAAALLRDGWCPGDPVELL